MVRGGVREGASVLRPMSARGPTSARVVSLHARGDASRRPVSAAFRPRPVLRVAVWETEAAARSGTAQALRRSAFPAAGRVARDERGFAVPPAYYPPGRLMRGVPSH